jgi:lysozyme
MSKLMEQIKRHEGLRLKPYRCTANKLTIGYGRNIDDVGISEAEAEVLLSNDLARCANEVAKHVESFGKLNEARQSVLVNMCFNLGIAGLLKFNKFIAAVNDGLFELASKEMLDSQWAKQVGNRAIELSEQMKTGVWK